MSNTYPPVAAPGGAMDRIAQSAGGGGFPFILECRGSIVRLPVLWMFIWWGLAWGAAPEGPAVTNGSIAIFKDDIPSDTVHPDPERMACVLADCGFAVDFADEARLGDADGLSAERYDVLIVPYGASFPRARFDNIVAFLKAGGHLFVAGGYAFDRPLFKSDNRWVDAEQWALSNGLALSTGFENDEIGTNEISPGAFVDVIGAGTHTGTRARRLRCEAPTGEPVEAAWSASCVLPPDGGGVLWVSVWARWLGRPPSPSHFKIVIDQLDSEGKRVHRRPILDHHTTASSDWRRLAAAVALSKDARTLAVSFSARGIDCALVIDDMAVASATDILMNTHFGIPLPSGKIQVHPLQVGMFDPVFTLTDVASVRLASRQGITDAPFEYDGEVTGWAAVGKFGNDQVIFARQWAKWVPVLESFDQFGRRRGPVAAVAYNYGGPYARSSWAFFGADNVDPFGMPGGEELLADVVRALVRSVFTYDVAPEYACYRVGESVKISGKTANFGKGETTLEARLTVFEKGAGEKEVVFSETRMMTALPHSTRQFDFRFTPDDLTADVYEVRLELLAGGALVDVSRTGFAVWHDETIAKGLPLSYRNNYFHAGERPYYLHAVKTPGFIFSNPDEGPLNWDDEIALMKDNGIDVYEFIQVWPFAKKLDDFETSGKKLLRQLDALAVVSQRHRVVMKPSIFDGVNPGAGDDELARQVEWAALLGRRYRDVPGLSYDLEGDIPLSIWKVPPVKRLFNEWLSARYGTTERLRAAWQVTPPEGALPNVELNVKTTGRWDDAKLHDIELFKTFLFLRWSRAIRTALEESGSTAPICAEFLPNLDQAGSSRHLDYSTLCGYYKDDSFPGGFASTDLRVVGKSLGLNEYGVTEHPAHAGRYHYYRLPAKQIPFYLAIGHYVLGLGGSVNLVWDWKDNIEAEFPWGLAHRCDVVPKPKLKAYRNMSFLFRMFDLKYEPSEVYLVVPDSNRLGNLTFWEFDPFMKAAVDALLELHVPFGVVHERHVEALPESAKVLIWPIPFFPPDEAVAHVRDLVAEGCALYISGDLSFDEARRRSRASRLEDLAGVRFVSTRYPYLHAPEDATVPLETASQAWSVAEGAPCIDIEAVTATVVAADPEGRAVAVTNMVGKGRVFYTTDIPEALSAARTKTLYENFLKWVEVLPAADVRRGTGCDVMRIALSDGGKLYILYNRLWEPAVVELVTPAGVVKTALAPRRPGVLAVTGAGEVFAVECESDVTLDGELFLSATGQVMVAALDRRSLSTSSALLVMPIDDCRTAVAHTEGVLEVEMGDIERGKWRTFTRATQAGDAEGLVPLHDQARSLELFIAAPSGKLSQARKLLEDWVMRPDSLATMEENGG